MTALTDFPPLVIETSCSDALMRIVLDPNEVLHLPTKGTITKKLRGNSHDALIIAIDLTTTTSDTVSVIPGCLRAERSIS